MSQPSGPGRGLLLLVAAAFFMENLDATIVTTAAPAMARSLHVSAAAIGVAITAYLVTVAAVIPASGWVSDRWGPRRTFGLAVVVFTLASGACALCTSLPELTAARVVQAAGGALMVPVGRLTVFQSTDRRDLIRVVAWLTWPALAAPVAAPLIGGALVTYLSWPWIFVVNLPLGAVALVLTPRLVPGRTPHPHRPLDVVGALLSATSLASLVYAADLIASPDDHWPAAAAFGGVGLLLGIGTVRHLLRAPHPLVDLRPLRIRTFRVPHAGGSLFRASVFAVPFLLALELQDGFGWTPLRAGVLVMLIFVGNLGIKPTTTGLLRRFGFRRVLLSAIIASAVCTASIAALNPDTPVVAIAALLIAGGAARSIGFTSYNTIALSDIDPGEMTQASTLSSSVQQLAQGLGIALAALALRAGVAVTGSTPAAVTAFRIGFGLIGLVCLAALLDAWRLPHDAGAALTAA